jgi:hypothetical protein
MKHTKIFLVLFLCFGCQRQTQKNIPFALQEIKGRDEMISWRQSIRRPVYQAKVPLTWKRIDPLEKESLLDTTKPIVSFVIDQDVVLNVHNFPADSLEERIPPTAQIERWHAQLKPQQSKVEPIGHGGFTGLYFEGKSENVSLLAWSLQLDIEHFQYLHFLAATVEEEEHYKQMAADYTIKVYGPSAQLEKHLEEFFLFSNSFELIQEIPERV